VTAVFELPDGFEGAGFNLQLFSQLP